MATYYYYFSYQVTTPAGTITSRTPSGSGYATTTNNTIGCDKWPSDFSNTTSSKYSWSVNIHFYAEEGSAPPKLSGLDTIGSVSYNIRYTGSGSWGGGSTYFNFTYDGERKGSHLNTSSYSSSYVNRSTFTKTFPTDAQYHAVADSINEKYKGYKLVEWKRASGSDTYFNATIKPGASDYTTHGGTYYYHAVLEPKTATVTLNKNGGTGGTSSVTATYNSAMPSISSLPSKTGATFLGYFSDDGTQYYNADGTSAKTCDFYTNKTLYARWKEVTYTVKFDSNGGTGTMSDQTITRDTDTALNDNKFSYIGKDFASWNTKKDGTGTKYSNKQKVKNLADADKSITLFAQWTDHLYKLTANANSGTISTVPSGWTKDGIDKTYTTRKYEQKFGTLPTAARLYYSFREWRLDGSKVTDNSDMPARDITIYAYWGDINTYEIKLTGDGVIETTYHVKCQSYTDTIANPTRIGYTFNGWDISGMDSTTHYHGTTDNDTKNTSTTATTLSNIKSTRFKNLRSTNGTVTFTAKWTAENRSITYNANWPSGTTGSGSVPKQTVKYNESVTISTNKFVVNKVTAKGYIVTFNSHGGSSINPIQQENTTTYSFSKWNTKSNGSGTNYNPGTKINLTSNIDLYAQWNSNTVKGSITLPTPTKAGYIFGGWYEDPELTDQADNPYTPKKDITLHAKWTEDIFKITLNKQSGSGGTDAIWEKYGEGFYSNSEATTKITSIESFPTRSGYRFKGYYTTTSGGTQVISGDPMKRTILASNKYVTKNTTWYARWEKDNSFVYNGSAWKPIKYMYVYNGSTWKFVKDFYVYNNAWKAGKK